MPSNIEIKARVNDFEKLKETASALSGEPGTLIVQNDTFFNVPNCRLKMRQLQDRPSQLIYYERADQAGPKFSDYHISYTDTPEDLKATLSKALGIKGVVNKRRLLYMVGQTRIHVDQVENLGNFMELEVVMKEDQPIEEGQDIANDLMRKLDIKKDDLIEGAYMDMIINNKQM